MTQHHCLCLSVKVLFYCWCPAAGLTEWHQLEVRQTGCLVLPRLTHINELDLFTLQVGARWYVDLATGFLGRYADWFIHLKESGYLLLLHVWLRQVPAWLPASAEHGEDATGMQQA